MKLARRVEQLPPYLFVEISRKIAEKRARGERVISFAIGDPDIPTPANIVDCLCQAARDPKNHRYPETDGLPELRKAIADWYARRFGVTLDLNKEVLPLIGSKEGIAHVALCLLDPGDVALVPDPGYPVYSIATMLVGAQSYFLPLLEKNNYLPDLDAIPEDVARKAKVLWLNYPNNPTGATAGPEFFKKAISFARKYDIAICHDGPYSDVVFDGYEPASFLQVPGAKDVGIEFHSCSKTYNMTGWRIGMAVGNATLINALMRMKSNMDSGIFQAIQYAAIEALTGPQDCIAEHNIKYQRRRDVMVKGLHEMGWMVDNPKASMYIWAKIPEHYRGMGSLEFSKKILNEAKVAVSPGVGFGDYGDDHVRIALIENESRSRQALRGIKDMFKKDGLVPVPAAGSA